MSRHIRLAICAAVAAIWPTRVRLPLAFATFFSVAACGSSDKPAADTPVAAALANVSHGRNTPERVTLTEAAYQTARLEVALVEAAGQSALSAPLEVPGEVEIDPRRLALVSPRVPGRIERLMAVEGDRVAAGQVVALIYSGAYVAAQNDFLQATRRAKLLAQTPDAQGAAALAQAATRRLSLIGASTREIEHLAESGEPRIYLEITAPFTGSIIEAHGITGQAIEAGSPIFKVADLSSVDVVARIPEAALASVKVGQGASILTAAYPGTRFAGRLERLHDDIDPETRTLHAVIHVANSNRVLRPGMFASVLLNVGTGGRLGNATSALTIPDLAVVTDGETRYVFVEIAPRTYERREVKLATLDPIGSARPQSGRVAVLEGINPGERVVIHGAFTLKSELAKAALSDDH